MKRATSLDTPCIEWPKTRLKPHGYGLWWDPPAKRYWLAHRRAWMLRHGPIPRGMKVMHRCDNPPCYNVEHLRVGSQADNLRDAYTKRRIVYGERSHRAKLTDAQAREIRERCDAGERYGSLAREFGVRNETIGFIARRQKWRFLDRDPDEEYVRPKRPHEGADRAILALYELGCSQQQIADSFGVSQATISRIIRRERARRTSREN